MTRFGGQLIPGGCDAACVLEVAPRGEGTLSMIIQTSWAPVIPAQKGMSAEVPSVPVDALRTCHLNLKCRSQPGRAPVFQVKVWYTKDKDDVCRVFPPYPLNRRGKLRIRNVCLPHAAVPVIL